LGGATQCDARVHQARTTDAEWFIERFNRTYCEAVLDMFVFQTLDEVREQTEPWLKKYNEERPHKSLPSDA
jgi:hypothetical protein